MTMNNPVERIAIIAFWNRNRIEKRASPSLSVSLNANNRHLISHSCHSLPSALVLDRAGVASVPAALRPLIYGLPIFESIQPLPRKYQYLNHSNRCRASTSTGSALLGFLIVVWSLRLSPRSLLPSDDDDDDVFYLFFQKQK